MSTLLRRRCMMQEKTTEVWDYVFETYTNTPVHVTAGQTVTIKYAPSTKLNGYIYYCTVDGVISPAYRRVASESTDGGTITKTITADGVLYFGTNNNNSDYYKFNGAYIKVRIT